MTSDEIDKMTAGRRLDALVAIKVMGLMVHPDLGDSKLYGGGPPLAIKDSANGEYGKMWGETPHYSTDFAIAWEVVIKFNTTGDPVSLDYLPTYLEGNEDKMYWQCKFRVSESIGAGSTESLAICRAALKSVMVKQ
jgi:hypothetical protein